MEGGGSWQKAYGNRGAIDGFSPASCLEVVGGKAFSGVAAFAVMGWEFEKRRPCRRFKRLRCSAGLATQR
jgi:hypothetical protein